MPATIVLTLALAGGIACWVPARRALGIKPAEALSADFRISHLRILDRTESDLCPRLCPNPVGVSTHFNGYGRSPG
jgi:hypothetical protein